MGSKVQNKYRQKKVWLWMRRQGRPVNRQEIVEKFGISENAASCILRRLKLDGFVEIANGRKTWGSTWVTKGLLPPECSWGMATETLEALKPMHGKWEENLQKAFKAKGIDWSPPEAKPIQVIKPKATTALERCWGWLPNNVATGQGAD